MISVIKLAYKLSPPWITPNYTPLLIRRGKDRCLNTFKQYCIREFRLLTVITKAKNLSRILSTTENFLCPLLVYLGFIKKCEAALIDGSIVEVSKESWNTYWRKVSFLF